MTSQPHQAGRQASTQQRHSSVTAAAAAAAAVSAYSRYSSDGVGADGLREVLSRCKSRSFQEAPPTLSGRPQPRVNKNACQDNSSTRLESTRVTGCRTATSRVVRVTSGYNDRMMQMIDANTHDRCMHEQFWIYFSGSCSFKLRCSKYTAE